MYLTDEQHLHMLKKVRDRIANGETMVLDDSDDIGNKHTHCSWGQCTDKGWEKEALFRKDTPLLGSKYHDKGQICPFDKDQAGESVLSPAGCYHRCKIFQNSRGNRPSREEALELYNITINSFKEKML